MAPASGPHARGARDLGRGAQLIVKAASILLALSACAELGGSDGGRGQAFDAFVAAEDEAQHQLRLFQEESPQSCTSEHLAKASAGANTNLALLDPSHPPDPTRDLDPGVVSLVQTNYGNRPIEDAAGLTLSVANSAADAGCKDQARVLYHYVLDRYVKSDYASYRQRAEVGLAQLGGK